MKNYKAHILVVDDDDGIRNLVKKFLNEKSFLVNTASSAEEAQKKVAIIKIGAVRKIQCLCLPQLDGNLSINNPMTGSVKISVNLPKKKITPTKDRPNPRSSA